MPSGEGALLAGLLPRPAMRSPPGARQPPPLLPGQPRAPGLHRTRAAGRRRAAPRRGACGGAPARPCAASPSLPPPGFLRLWTGGTASDPWSTHADTSAYLNQLTS